MNCLNCGDRVKESSRNKYCSHKCYISHKWGYVENRIWDKVQQSGSDECWPWIGTRDKNGYGMFSNFRRNGKREQRASRIIWILTHGEIPTGMFVLHRCDNPPCCNPRHLFLGSPLDNMQDKMSKGRHKCPTGETHKLSKLTTEIVLDIRRLFSAGISQREIARRFQIGFKNVNKIVHRQRWKHV